ncbi:hypothetical protein L2E82_13162 [Cichorium intybus]|uniref:Uncharacterized protein n=1 Tax=Cichorium intybus TaxID=13427 RepID=A0ACB9GJ35_CICIN|nr:hypothetical protein L2E82_13162 [Cichorium intybus]
MPSISRLEINSYATVKLTSWCVSGILIALRGCCRHPSIVFCISPKPETNELLELCLFHQSSFLLTKKGSI